MRNFPNLSLHKLTIATTLIFFAISIKIVSADQQLIEHIEWVLHK
jgi:hypothetical protein